MLNKKSLKQPISEAENLADFDLTKRGTLYLSEILGRGILRKNFLIRNSLKKNGQIDLH